MSTFTRCAEYVRQHCFAVDAGPPTIGAEIELLPLDAKTLRVRNLLGVGGLIEVLRANASTATWVEQNAQHDIPRFHTQSGGVISFEPGGQIEYSTPPFTSATSLLCDLEHHITMLERVLNAAGVMVQHTGIDPYNSIDAAPLQVTTPRYTTMARYFAECGPAGARMMRQTSALQVSVGSGEKPLERWRLLNRLAPALIALFANSRCYERRDSGYASYRAQTWRETDPARTGIFAGEDSVREYTQFALDAPDILHGAQTEDFIPFSERVPAFESGAFAAHLTTLFPEIRPRGWFEIRSIDAQPRAGLVAAIVFLTGIVLDDQAAAAALELLPEASEELLFAAGRDGSAASKLQPILPDLVDLAIAGCSRLHGFIEAAAVEKAREWLQSRVTVST